MLSHLLDVWSCFVPNVLKIVSRHSSFFKYRGRGGPWGPGGTLSPPFGTWTSIKFVAADITHGAAGILHSRADILCGMVSAMCLTYCLSNTNFLISVLGKNTIFSKSAKKLVELPKNFFPF